MLTGAPELLRGDLERLTAEGATEVFLDPNFDPRIASPDADPAEAQDRAWRLLEALAPAAR
jgi:hypothetical protein